MTCWPGLSGSRSGRRSSGGALTCTRRAGLDLVVAVAAGAVVVEHSPVHDVLAWT